MSIMISYTIVRIWTICMLTLLISAAATGDQGDKNLAFGQHGLNHPKDYRSVDQIDYVPQEQATGKVVVKDVPSKCLLPGPVQEHGQNISTKSRMKRFSFGKGFQESMRKQARIGKYRDMQKAKEKPKGTKNAETQGKTKTPGKPKPLTNLNYQLRNPMKKPPGYDEMLKEQAKLKLKLNNANKKAPPQSPPTKRLDKPDLAVEWEVDGASPKPDVEQNNDKNNNNNDNVKIEQQNGSKNTHVIIIIVVVLVISLLAVSVAFMFNKKPEVIKKVLKKSKKKLGLKKNKPELTSLMSPGNQDNQELDSNAEIEKQNNASHELFSDDEQRAHQHSSSGAHGSRINADISGTHTKLSHVSAKVSGVNSRISRSHSPNSRRHSQKSSLAHVPSSRRTSQVSPAHHNSANSSRHSHISSAVQSQLPSSHQTSLRSMNSAKHSGRSYGSSRTGSAY